MSVFLIGLLVLGGFWIWLNIRFLEAEGIVRLGMREWFFGLYLVANLAIILFSIWLWSRGMTAEAVFVGLWAPTLDLLYVMVVVTFTPFERGRPSRRARPSVPSRPGAARRGIAAQHLTEGLPWMTRGRWMARDHPVTVTCSRGDRPPPTSSAENLATRQLRAAKANISCAKAWHTSCAPLLRRGPASAILGSCDGRHRGHVPEGDGRGPHPSVPGAALGSIALSALLRIFGKDAALFVGQWPPTFILFALAYKLLRPSDEDRFEEAHEAVQQATNLVGARS